MPNPIEHGTLYDYITLAGVRSPGLCDVAGAGTVPKWDEKPPTGASGATLVYTGDGLAEFTIAFRAWLPQHFTEWEAFFLPLVTKGPTDAKPQAKDISHPFLDELGINSVVSNGTTQWTQVGAGMFERTTKFKQYREPKAAIAKASGSKAGGAGGGAGGNGGGGAAGTPKAAEPQSEIDKQISDLTKQVTELAA